MNRKLRGFFAVGMLTSLITGCENFLEVSPPHLLTADNLYGSVAGFEAGLNGLYALVRQEQEGLEGGGNNAHRQLFWATGVDNAAGTADGVAQLVNELGSRLNATDPRLRMMWNWLYSTINAANTLIIRAEGSELGWTEAEKNQTIAEARLIRAWAYRHLTYLWGDVPLHLDESSGDAIKADWTRAPVAQVRAQIEEDLLYAAEHLPESNGSRPAKAAAQHYLAELYLAMDQPQRAADQASAVTGSARYSLVRDRYGIRSSQPGVSFMDQFVTGNVLPSQGNTEVLWAFEYEQGVEGGGSSRMRRAWVAPYYEIPGIVLSEEHGGRGVGRGRPTRWAIEAYEPQDDRGSIHALRRFYIYNSPTGLPAGVSPGDTLWLKVADVNPAASDQITTRKWDAPESLQYSAAAHSWPDVPYLRLAETYLLLAEAQLALGATEDAAETLNIVRLRSNASRISAADVTLDFILDERSRELLSEEHRRYTLVRTGKFLERTRKYNEVVGPRVQDHHVLLPIPQAVIDANLGHAMPQNRGY